MCWLEHLQDTAMVDSRKAVSSEPVATPVRSANKNQTTRRAPLIRVAAGFDDVPPSSAVTTPIHYRSSTTEVEQVRQTPHKHYEPPLDVTTSNHENVSTSSNGDIHRALLDALNRLNADLSVKKRTENPEAGNYSLRHQKQSNQTAAMRQAELEKQRQVARENRLNNYFNNFPELPGNSQKEFNIQMIVPDLIKAQLQIKLVKAGLKFRSSRFERALHWSYQIVAAELNHSVNQGQHTSYCCLKKSIDTTVRIAGELFK